MIDPVYFVASASLDGNRDVLQIKHATSELIIVPLGHGRRNDQPSRSQCHTASFGGT